MTTSRLAYLLAILVGYLDAAAFYFPNGLPMYVCPLCIMYHTLWGTPILRALRLTAIFGTVNAIVLTAIVWVMIRARTRLAIAKHEEPFAKQPKNRDSA